MHWALLKQHKYIDVCIYYGYVSLETWEIFSAHRSDQKIKFYAVETKISEVSLVGAELYYEKCRGQKRHNSTTKIINLLFLNLKRWRPTLFQVVSVNMINQCKKHKNVWLDFCQLCH